MIDFETEEVVTMTEAAKQTPGRPDVSTLWRWRTRGVNGIRLETFKVGKKRFTSLEAIARFIEKTTAAADGAPTPHPESDRARERRLERIDAELAREGF